MKLLRINADSKDPAAPITRNCEGLPDTPRIVCINPAVVVALEESPTGTLIHLHTKNVVIQVACDILKLSDMIAENLETK